MPDQMQFRVAPKQVEAARAKLAEAGFPISGDSGTVENDGYRIGYTLADGALILEVLSKPRIVPMRIVKSRIRAFLAGERIVEQG